MPINGSLKKIILTNIIVAVIYLGLAALMPSGSDDIQNSFTSKQLSVCPVTSIETAAAILIGPFIWPGVAIAAFAVAIINGFSIPSALLAALAHSMGVLASGLVVQHRIKVRNPFLKVGDFVHYLVIIALFISGGTTALRVLSIVINHNNLLSFPSLFINLWGIVINSLLVITPFIIAWSTKPVPGRRKFPLHAIIIALALTIALISWTFSANDFENSSIIHIHSEYIIIPIVILATGLFGLRGTVSVSFAYSLCVFLAPMFSSMLFFDSISPEFQRSFQSIVAGTGLLAAAALSERDQALQHILQLNSTQQAFLNNAGIWLNTMDAENNIITWSKGAERVSGYTFQEVANNQNFWDNVLLSMEDDASVKSNFLTAIHDGTYLQNFEVPIKNKSGQVRLISWNIDTLKTQNGKNIGRTISGTDVTAQREAENHLRQERDLAEALVNAAMIISGTLEREEIIHRVLSQAMAVIPCDGVNLLMLQDNKLQVVYQYGYEILNDPDRISLTHFSPAETRTILENAESGERTIIEDTSHDPRWFPTPTTDWIRSHISVPIKLRGSILGLVNLDSSNAYNFNYAHVRTLKTLCALISNIFENVQRYDDMQFQAEELDKRVKERTSELSLANQQLQRALRLKDEFLANMSHELRTPLTAILGMSELLESQVRGPMNETQIRYTKTIIDSGQHLLSLINDILDLAKIEAEKLDIAIETIHVSEVCESCIYMIRPLAQAKNIQLDFTLQQPGPVIQADPLRLKQILINLLNNAVKFTPEGGTVGLEVHKSSSAPNILFHIWDTGIGIAPEDANKLFKPFSQLDGSLSRSFEGAGLGLTLVAKLVELHGGSIKMESDGVRGKGTKLTITLPMNQEELLSSDLPPSPSTADVLLIEDNNNSIQQINQALNCSGFTVRAAKCTEEAADLDRSGYPDLVIINMQTCKTDGWDTLGKLRSWFSPCTPPIIALTSVSLPGDNERAVASGVSAYLEKPVNLKQLSTLVSTLLGKSETYD